MARRKARPPQRTDDRSRLARDAGDLTRVVPAPTKRYQRDGPIDLLDPWHHRERRRRLRFGKRWRRLTSRQRDLAESFARLLARRRRKFHRLSRMIHCAQGAQVAAMSETIQPHILVVDDDAQIRELLQEYLAENSLRVSTAATSAQMSAILAGAAIDLVVLDLRLPDEDGISIARALRSQSSIPIIMLTGVRDEADRVMGLELGADDFLTKPFSPRELLARIRTVLRRSRTATPAQARGGEIRAYRFAGFELNLRTRRLATSRGRRIELTNGEFNLLAAFLAAPQRLLTRDQMLEASRVHDNEVYDRAIDVQILRLRRKIEADPSQPKFILTERGAGYLFDAPVQTIY
jgi:two-component system OmpR family response regulator